MRKLNSIEKEKIKEDLLLLEEYLKSKDLFYDKVKNKFDSINFFVETKSELGGINGGFGRIRNLRSGKKEISILDDIMDDEKERASTCYHEIGHALMGMSSYDKKDIYDKVFNYINEIKRSYPYELLEEKFTYLLGMQCLEEYLVETFAQEMLFKCRGIEKSQKRQFTCPGICADYIYESTSKSKYGIFETIGEELVLKTFGNIDTAIVLGLKEKYFESFFKKFNEKEIMMILGNLGKVYQAIMIYTGNYRNNYKYYSQDRVKCFLYETREIVNNLQSQFKKKNKSYRINYNK